MNKITTDIISTTGINISKYDILPSKVFINGVEVTDTESWNKAISNIEEKDKEIERLKEELKNRPIVDFTFDVYKELEDYKSRIDKAIAYIKQRTEFGEYDYAFPSVLNQDEVRKIRNILNGSDEE